MQISGHRLMLMYTRQERSFYGLTRMYKSFLVTTLVKMNHMPQSLPIYMTKNAKDVPKSEKNNNKRTVRVI